MKEFENSIPVLINLWCFIQRIKFRRFYALAVAGSMLNLVFVSGANAQKPTVEWYYAKEGGVYADVILTDDGGVIYTMTSLSSPTNTSLVRLSQDGKLVWQKNFGGTSDDVIYSLLKTSEGFLFTGYSNSTDGDLKDVAHVGNGWIGEIDFDGDILWQKRYDGVDRINKIIDAQDGDRVILATVSANSSYVKGHHGGNDIWVAKISSKGDTLWTTPAMGGTGHETAIGFGSIQEDRVNGGYIFTARTTTTDDGDILFGGNRESSGKFWVVKLDDRGGMVWQKRYGGSHTSSLEGPKSVVVTNEGNYVISGTMYSSDEDITRSKGGGKNDTWVLWLDKNGEKIQDISYGGTAVDPNTGGMIATNDGGYLLIGRSQSLDGDIDDNEYYDDPSYAPWLAKITNSGQIEWTKYLIINKQRGATSNTAVQHPDGGIIVLSNKWIAKLRPCPEHVSLTASACENEGYEFNGKRLTASGQYKDTLLTVGGCDSIVTLNFQLNPAYTVVQDASICAGETFEFYDQILTKAGPYLHVLKTVAGCDSIISLRFAVNSPAEPVLEVKDNMLTTGSYAQYEWFYNDEPLTAAGNSFELTQPGLYHVVVADANGCSDTSSVYAHLVTSLAGTSTTEIRIHPNPASDQITVSYPAKNYEISICDMSGQEQIRQRAAGETSVSIGTLQQGLYLLKIIENGEMVSVQKIVKQ